MPEDEITEKPCEVCNQPVHVDERQAVLRADGEHWRHPWHLEPV